MRQQVEYFEKRRAMMRYAEFEQAGYPLGSGSVESANQLVVEARLKQAGMHWASSPVNPMVALRNVACNGLAADRRPSAAGEPSKEAPTALLADSEAGYFRGEGKAAFAVRISLPNSGNSRARNPKGCAEAEISPAVRPSVATLQLWQEVRSEQLSQ